MNNRFFQLAKKLSELSNYRQHRLGAVIVRKNKVVGVGFNKNKTHPRSTHAFRHIHAELSAVLNSKSDISGCDIYVYRETKDGLISNARPCQYCYAMLKVANVKNVYYTKNGEYCKEVIQ